jgi:sugar O-acyltransferase (sialic acid O-acetyltransferase NeuD family)
MAPNDAEAAGDTVLQAGNIPPRIVFILGSGGFARELGVYFQTTSSATIIYVDDSFSLSNSEGIPINDYHKIMELLNPRFMSIMGSGKPDIKEKMLTQIRGPIATYKHPNATILSEVGEGCVIGPSAVIAPNVVIGRHVLVNYCASVGHNTVVEDLAVISPNASIGGFCRIGRGAYIGAGANIREHITIGIGAVVGMGAVVVKDVPDGVTAVGVPARWD